MKVSQWAEIRRLREIEGLSKRAIAARLHCCHTLVTKALSMEQPPNTVAAPVKISKLDPYKKQIDDLISRYPNLSAVRVLEEISKGENGYTGKISILKDYLQTIRPARGRVYTEVMYDPGEAIQVDWGSCGRLQIGNTWRRISVLVAVLCYSRMCYIEFSLSERKADFYRCIVNALRFFGGVPQKVIFDNLNAAVLFGAGRHATLHPEFSELCGYFYLQPIACAARDPESKGLVETNVRYVKQNALAGRDHELLCWDDYAQLAAYWRDHVANTRIHATTQQRPLDRFVEEKAKLRRLPAVPFSTDEVVSAKVSPHARIKFDANRYSVPPALARKTVVVRADDRHVRVWHQGHEVACHPRCFERQQLIRSDEHLLEAKTKRRHQRRNAVETAFAALGPTATTFHLNLIRRPVKPMAHLRRLLKLVDLYGRADVVAAMQQALQFETYDASYVEAILHQLRRQRDLPSPTEVLPRCPAWIDETDYEIPDPASYDCLLDKDTESHEDQADEP